MTLGKEKERCTKRIGAEKILLLQFRIWSSSSSHCQCANPLICHTRWIKGWKDPYLSTLLKLPEGCAWLGEWDTPQNFGIAEERKKTLWNAVLSYFLTDNHEMYRDRRSARSTSPKTCPGTSWKCEQERFAWTKRRGCYKAWLRVITAENMEL